MSIDRGPNRPSPAAASLAIVLFAAGVLQGCQATTKPKGIPYLTHIGGTGQAKAPEGAKPESQATPREVAEAPRSKAEDEPVLAGPADTMKGAVAAALDYSSDVRGAAADVDTADMEVEIAKSGYMPSVHGSAGMGKGGEEEYQVGVSQPIYDWGNTRAEVSGARARYDAKRFTLDAEREAAALKAAQAYISFKRYEAQAQAADGNLAAHRRIADLARDRVAGGVGDDSEIERAGVNQGEAESALEDAHGALRDARSVYVSRIGRQPGKLAGVPDLPLSLSELKDVREAASSAPAVAAALAEGEAARQAVKAQRAALFPKLSAEAYVNKDSTSSEHETYVGVKLTTPTYAGFSAFQKVDAARLKAERAGWTAESATREAVDAVRAFQDRAPTLKARLRILEAQLKRARALRSLYEDQFVIGDRSLTDLLSVQSDVFRIERTLIEARHDIYDLQYAAAAALGQLRSQLGRVKG